MGGESDRNHAHTKCSWLDQLYHVSESRDGRADVQIKSEGGRRQNRNRREHTSLGVCWPKHILVSTADFADDLWTLSVSFAVK